MTDLILTLPTKRIREVAETVAIVDENVSTHGHHATIMVFDDSSKDLSARYVEKLASRKTKQRLQYVGPAEKERFLGGLERVLGSRVEPHYLRELFRPCYGGNRNFTALYTLGNFLVSLDDDMRPYGLTIPGTSTSDHSLVSEGVLRRRNDPFIAKKPMDILGPYLAVLGKRCADIPRNYRKGDHLVDSAMDLTTNASVGLTRDNIMRVEGAPPSDESIVVMAQSFRTGTNDIDALDFVEMCIEDEGADTFDTHEDLYVLSEWHPAVTEINWRMDCGVAGYDNRIGIPPFIASPLRFEDYLYRLWIQRGGVAAAHVDLVMTHLKSTYMRHPHAAEVLNEELSNLVKRKILANGFSPKESTVELNFDGEITLDDTTKIVDKIRRIHDRVVVAMRSAKTSTRRESLAALAASIFDSFCGLEPEMFHLETSRTILREYRLLKWGTEVWPTLIDAAKQLRPEERAARQLSGN